MRSQPRSTAAWRGCRSGANRTGFTLIELLIVITILLILAAVTLAVFNATADSDRLRAATRQVQSALLGARDRAIYAQKAATFGQKVYRGVRLVRDANNPNLVTGFAFIQSTEPVLLGTGPSFRADDPRVISNSGLQFVRDGADIRRIYLYAPPVARPALFLTPPPPMSNPDGYILDVDFPKPGHNSEFKRLFQLGLIRDGDIVRVQIGGEVHSSTISTARIDDPNNTATDDGALVLVDPVPVYGTSYNGVTLSLAYEWGSDAALSENRGITLELGPSLLPGEEVLKLPGGAAIALSLNGTNLVPGANLPSTWTLSASGPPMDILFSPRGTITGPEAALGVIHFLVGTIGDLDQGFLPGSAQSSGNWLVVSLYTHTGQVLTSPIDLTDNVDNTTGTGPADGLPDNIFSFAKRGEVAGR
jgi:prepilin-type N-terminal cleavage/methylation domain-containing protein